MAYNTGNPIGSDAVEDFVDNIVNLDHWSVSTGATFTDRLGNFRATLTGMTAEARQQITDAITALGWNPVSGDFTVGGTLTNRNDVLWYPAGSSYYSWLGALPKVVAPASTPIGDSNWVDRTDGALRSELALTTGAALVGTSAGDTVQEFIDSVPVSIADEALNNIATSYNLDVANGGYWTNAEVINIGDWRVYGNKVWTANSNGVACGAAPDYTNFHRTLPWLASNEVAVSTFGAVAEGGDVTAAATAAITFAKANGYKDVVFDYDSCLITGALPQLNASFDFVLLKSRHGSICDIDATAAGNYCFSYVGGSGQLAGVVMQGLSIYAPANQPILVQGFCGARFVNCKLDRKT